MTLHIFNPEHDMALAANDRNWTSPHAGRELRNDLAWIPALWANDGDHVLVDDVGNAKWCYRRLKLERKKADVVFVTIDELGKYDQIIPWGWDKSIVHQLRRAGVDEIALPTDEYLDKIRTLSGRQTTLRLLPLLRDGIEHVTCGDVVSKNNIEEIEEYLRHNKNAVVKSPWSCSGRGVKYFSDGVITENERRWMIKSLRQQGEMMIEPLYDKILDFGMEFEIHDGKAQYHGLSLFETVNGAYIGSTLATEEEKIGMLTRYVDASLLTEIQNRICGAMTTMAAFYEGCFGVDMMIVKGADAGSQPLLHPCVELNLRRTMGHTALTLSPNEPLRKHIMQITYESKHYHLRIFNNDELLY